MGGRSSGLQPFPQEQFAGHSQSPPSRQGGFDFAPDVLPQQSPRRLLVRDPAVVNRSSWRTIFADESLAARSQPAVHGFIKVAWNGKRTAIAVVRYRVFTADADTRMLDAEYAWLQQPR